MKMEKERMWDRIAEVWTGRGVRGAIRCPDKRVGEGCGERSILISHETRGHQF